MEDITAVVESWKKQPTIRKMISKLQLEIINKLWNEMTDKPKELKMEITRLKARKEERGNKAEMVKAAVSEELGKHGHDRTNLLQLWLERKIMQ